MKDLTKGYPAKVIIFFALPLIIGNIAQQLYSVTDSKIVSQFVSSNSLAAVGSTGVISNLIINLMISLTQGFCIVISQYFGSKDMKNVRRNVAGIFILTAIFSVVFTVAGFLTVTPVLKLLGTPNEILGEAVAYLRIIMIGIIFTGFYNMSANILRAMGDSKRPLYCLFVAIVANLVLDLVFIIVFHMGIKGAAYATIISQFLSAVLCFAIMMIKTREIIPSRSEYDLKLSEYGKLLTYGFSMGIMICIVNIGSVILQTSINSLGTTIVIAHTSARRVLDVLMVIIYTIGISMTTYTSQNYGAGRMDRIRKGLIHSVVIDTILSTVLLIWVFLWGADLVCWVASSNDPEILYNGALYLKIGIAFFYVLGPLFIFRCSLQGMGARVVPIITSIMELVIKILAVAFLVPALGYLGIALTEPISWVCMSIVLFGGVVYMLRKFGDSYVGE